MCQYNQASRYDRVANGPDDTARAIARTLQELPFMSRARPNLIQRSEVDGLGHSVKKRR